jgi:arsenical pump membrane protein
MAPVWLAVLVVEYVVLRVWFRVELSQPASAEPAAALPIPIFPVAVVAAMLLGFAISSPFGVDPAWVAVAAAVVLAARGLASRRTTLTRVTHSAHLTFGLFVLCLGVVVAALGAGRFGGLLADVVPHQKGLVGLLLVALLGAVLSNLVNNLPATLLLLPLLAPLGTTTLLAALVGINIGSGLTWTGSLANLLWRRTLIATQQPVPSREFHLVAAVATPLGIVAGVLVLDGWTRLLG